MKLQMFRGILCSSNCRNFFYSQKILNLRREFVTTRSFSSIPDNSSSIQASSLPPAIIRVALVGSSVGLASPLFGVAGSAYCWYKYLPQSPLGQGTKYAIGVLLGGGFWQLMYLYVGPFLLSNAEFVAPFAASNAITAAFWYSLAECIYGVRVLAAPSGNTSDKPIGSLSLKSLEAYVYSAGIQMSVGPIVGGLTAVTAPLLWPVAFQCLWSPDLQTIVMANDPYWISHFYETLILPIALPVGIISGFMMNWTLRPVVFGAKDGVPWTSRSLPALIAILSGSVFYFTQCKRSNEFYWIDRLNPVTGEIISYNARTKQFLSDEGKMADDIAWKRHSLESISWILRKGPVSAVVNLFSTNSYSSINENLQAKEWESNMQLLAPESFTVDNVKTLRNVYGLLDILIRWKKLNMNGDTSTSTKDTDHMILLHRLESKYNVTLRTPFSTSSVSLTSILNDIELLILTERKLLQIDAALNLANYSEPQHKKGSTVAKSSVSPGKDLNDSNNKNWKDMQTKRTKLAALKQELKERITRNIVVKDDPHSPSQTIAFTHKAVALLIANASIYEKELKHQLNIDVPDCDEEILMGKYKAGIWRDRMMDITVITGVVSLLAVIGFQQFRQ